MTITGNYWLNLLEKENRLKREIESTVKKFVGKRFYDKSEMDLHVNNAIKSQLENYGVKNRMGVFHLEYDVDLKHDSKFVLTGYEVKQICLEEDIW